MEKEKITLKKFKDVNLTPFDINLKNLLCPIELKPYDVDLKKFLKKIEVEDER